MILFLFSVRRPISSQVFAHDRVDRSKFVINRGLYFCSTPVMFSLLLTLVVEVTMIRNPVGRGSMQLKSKEPENEMLTFFEDQRKFSFP